MLLPYIFACGAVGGTIFSGALWGLNYENSWIVVTTIFALLVGASFIVMAILLGRLATKKLAHYAETNTGLLRLPAFPKSSFWLIVTSSRYLGREEALPMYCEIRDRASGDLVHTHSMRGVDIGFLRPVFWHRVGNLKDSHFIEIRCGATAGSDALKLQGWMAE